MSTVVDAAVLLPHLAKLRIGRVSLKAGQVRVEAATTGPDARCPGCGVASARVHSRYQRRLGDGGIGGWQVLVSLRVRRFFCDQDGCVKKTFAEQVDGLTRRHGRRTAMIEETMQVVGMALGGRAGARLVDQLAAPVSRSTLLRVVRRVPDRPVVTPRVLGVDDFARRRGHRYATILIDMDSGTAIDVLPDRNADTFAAWLREHPGVQVICRDRAGGYAEGAAQGAPDAVQVADRWHLMHNLSHTVRKVVAAHRRCLRPPAQPPAEAVTPPLTRKRPGSPQGRREANTRRRHAEVHRLRADKLSNKAIARRLQLDVKTVRKYVRADSPENLLSPNPPDGRDVLAAFKPFLHGRLDHQPGASTGDLLDEIRRRGYRGSERTLRRYLSQIRRQDAASPAPPPVASAREITAWIMRPHHKLDETDRLALNDACARCPDLAALTELAHGFAALVRNRGGAHLEEWIHKAADSSFPELRGFANGLYNDFDAVKTGLTVQWNSGRVEGHVNRIKMIKRQMYGRANLDLLRKRVLLA
jgi:transposase